VGVVAKSRWRTGNVGLLVNGLREERRWVCRFFLLGFKSLLGRSGSGWLGKFKKPSRLHVASFRDRATCRSVGLRAAVLHFRSWDGTSVADLKPWSGLKHTVFTLPAWFGAGEGTERCG